MPSRDGVVVEATADNSGWSTALIGVRHSGRKARSSCPVQLGHRRCRQLSTLSVGSSQTQQVRSVSLSGDPTGISAAALGPDLSCRSSTRNCAAPTGRRRQVSRDVVHLLVSGGRPAPVGVYNGRGCFRHSSSILADVGLGSGTPR